MSADSERCDAVSPTNGQVRCTRPACHSGDHLAPGHAWRVERTQDSINVSVLRGVGRESYAMHHDIGKLAYDIVHDGRLLGASDTEVAQAITDLKKEYDES